MTPRKLVRTFADRQLAFVATLETVFAAMNGTFRDGSASAEDLILRRAANDAEQR